MKTIFASAFMVLVSTQAVAKEEIWQGRGNILSISGEKQDTFQITMKVQKISPTQIKRKYTITPSSNAAYFTTTCTQSLQGMTWHSVCDDNTTESGFCTDLKNCVSYTTSEDSSTAYANNFFRSNEKISFIKTELRNGQQAIRIIDGYMLKQ